MKKKSGWRLIVPVVSLFAIAAVAMYLGDNGIDRFVQASDVGEVSKTEYTADGEETQSVAQSENITGTSVTEIGGDIRERIAAAATGVNSFGEGTVSAGSSTSTAAAGQGLGTDPDGDDTDAGESPSEDDSQVVVDEDTGTSGSDASAGSDETVSSDTVADEEEPVRTSDGRHIQIAGTEYALQYPVRTYLITGTDGSGNLMAIGDDYYGDFTDTIMALVVDDRKKTVGAVQIDRNTMVNVPVLDYQGNEAYTYFMQICIASIYGGNMDRGEKNVCKCVSELFGGVDINGYYALPVGGMASLNDTVGGVEVTMPVDYTDINSEYEKGATVTLYGKDAERFVRARSGVGDGTNRGRMRRQAIYMKAFTDTVHERLAEDKGFANDLFTAMRHETYTNIALDELISGLLELDGYENLGILTPSGTAELRETFNDGITLEENYMNYGSLQAILEQLYPIDKITG